MKSAYKTALLVLGMHRSGTSALAGVLGHLGAALPQDLMAASEMNAKGFFESNLITGFNDRLLESVGFTWWDTRRFPADWFDSPAAETLLAEAVEALESDFGDAALFVMKDPRICRLLPFWRKALDRFGAKPLAVHTHRPPLDVAASLTRWAGYETDYGLALWLRHALDAEAESRDMRRTFTTYEAVLSDWRAETGRIATALDIEWPRSQDTAADDIQDFLSRDLQHFSGAKQATPSAALPLMLSETLAILDRWARDGESADDHAVLDRLRGALDQVGPVYDGLALQAALRRGEVAALRDAVGQARDDLNRAAIRIGHLEASQRELEDRHAASERRLHVATVQLREFTAQRAKELTERLELSLALNDATAMSARIPALTERVNDIAAGSEQEQNRLRVERDRLASALAEMTAEKDRVVAANQQIATERDHLARDYHQLGADRDRLAAALAEMTAKKDRVVAAHQQIATERDHLARDYRQLDAELGKVAADRERLESESQQAAAERDRLDAEHQRVTTERDQAAAERDAALLLSKELEAEFRASTSWRVTAPLRFVSRLVGRGT